jgi:hypothetical protein
MKMRDESKNKTVGEASDFAMKGLSGGKPGDKKKKKRDDRRGSLM